MSRALALLALLVVSCSVPLDPPPPGDAEGGGPPRPGGVLRLGMAEDPRTLDPAKGYDVVSWSFEAMLFDTLVDYDDGTAIVPKLAASWTVSEDGRQWRFQLRPGVRFSSGRALGAEDVRYSLERTLRPSLRSPGAEFLSGIAGAEAYVAGQAATVAGLRTPAPDVVEIELANADPLFLHKLAMPFAAVVDREAAERDGDEAFVRHPVGSGPFRLVEWTYGQRLRLERNPHSWRDGRPYLDGIDVTIGVSDQLAWFKYQAGEVDISGIPSAEFPRVMADPRYRKLLLERTTLRTQYLGLNCEMPPFDTVGVRQALNLAVDKRRLVQLIDGRGVVATTVLPPDMPGHDARLDPYPYDPAAARARLAAAGFESGFATTLWATRDEGTLRLAQSMQQDLRRIGVSLAIKPVDFPALIEALRNPGMVPLFLLGWEADFPDPSNFLTVLLHSRSRGVNNNTFFASRRVDRILDLAEPLPVADRRLHLFRAAEIRILREAPWVPLFHPTGVAVRNPRVRNYRLHPLRPARYDEVWLAW